MSVAKSPQSNFYNFSASTIHQYFKPSTLTIFLTQWRRLATNKTLTKQRLQENNFWRGIIIEILASQFFSLSTLAEAIQVDKQWLLNYFLLEDENMLISATIAESLLNLHYVVRKDLRAIN